MKLKPDLSTPALCLKYLSEFRMDGERIGFLVNSSTKQEVALMDATDEMIVAAAHMLEKMVDVKKDDIAH